MATTTNRLNGTVQTERPAKVRRDLRLWGELTADQQVQLLLQHPGLVETERLWALWEDVQGLWVRTGIDPASAARFAAMGR